MAKSKKGKKAKQEVSNLPAALPANIAEMAKGLTKSVVDVAAGSGELYMKMTKTGRFVYGVEDTPTDEKSIWAVNPMGFQHGWIAWGLKALGTGGKMLGEHLAPSSLAMYPAENLEDVQGEWSKQIAIQMRCTEGGNKGTQVLYKANSDGGRKAYTAILGEVVERIQEGVDDIVPLLKLASTSYKHDEYGEIFKPAIEIVGWATMDSLGSDEEPPKPKKAKKKKAKKVKKEKVEEPEAQEEPEAPVKKKKKDKKTKAAKPDKAEPENDPAPEDGAAEESAPRRRRRRAA